MPDWGTPVTPQQEGSGSTPYEQVTNNSGRSQQVIDGVTGLPVYLGSTPWQIAPGETILSHQWNGAPRFTFNGRTYHYIGSVGGSTFRFFLVEDWSNQPVPTPTPGGGGPPPSGLGYAFAVNPGNNMPQALNLLRQAGFGWAKVQIRWEYYEGSRGNISWGEMDNIVNTAQQYGARVIFSVVTSPSWARPGKGYHGPPDNFDDYANFVGAVAARYRGRVQAYEIWNEQNYYAEWNGPGQMNAASYVDLLRRAYGAIKAADPNAIVISGGLTPGGNVGDLVIDDVTFMEQMYQAGLKNYSDVIGVHANVAGNNPPDDVPDTADTNTRRWHWSFFWKRFTQHYEVMSRYGDSGKQIWFTEFGWASIENVAPSPQPGYEYAAQISEAAHAQYLRRAFELAQTQYPYIGVMTVWNLNYNGGPNDEKSAWSVLRGDWAPRPAYNALATMPK